MTLATELNAGNANEFSFALRSDGRATFEVPLAKSKCDQFNFPVSEFGLISLRATPIAVLVANNDCETRFEIGQIKIVQGNAFVTLFEPNPLRHHTFIFKYTNSK